MADIGSLIIHLGVDDKGVLTTETTIRNLGGKIEDAAARSNKAWKNAINTMNSVAQRVRTVGYLTSAVLTAPILAAGKAILTTTKDFEYSMQKIVGLVGMSQNVVDQWSQSILKMAPAVGKTPKELAESLYFISSSGIKGAEALDVLEISARAATAGLGETQEVADLLTSVLNAYAGTGMTAAKAADILVAAVREGKGEADAYARSLGQLIPIASNLGVSFDQVAGGLAAMTLTGSSAANAAVYLKGVFNALMTANDQGAKVLARVGTSYKELRDILKGGPTGLINLMQRLRDIQVQYGDEALKDILPNIRALTGFLSIAGKNFQYNTKIMQEISKSTGSLNAAFLAVEDTIKVKLDKAIARLQVSLITLGTDVVPTIIKVINRLSAWLDKIVQNWNTLTDAQKKFRLEALAITAAIGPMALLSSAVIYVVSGVLQLGKALWVGGKAITQFTIAAVKGEKALATFFATMKVKSAASVAALTASFGPWIALVTALVLAYRNLKKARDEAEAALPSISDKTAIDPYIEELATIRGGDFGESAIESKMKLLSKMDLEQLRDFQNIIGTRIQLEKNFRIKLMAIREKGLEDDEYIQKRKNQIFELGLNLLDKQKSLDYVTKGSDTYKAIEKEIDAVKNTMSNLSTAIVNHKKEMNDWINTQITKVPELTSTYEGYQKQVTDLIGEIEGLLTVTDQQAQSIIEYNEALEGIKDTYQSTMAYLEYMRKNAKKLGIEFDYVGEKSKTLQDILEDLAKIKALDTTFAKDIAQQLENLPTNLYSVIQSLKELGEEFKFIEERAKIDVEFDIHAEKINALESVRDELLRVKSVLKEGENITAPLANGLSFVIPVADLLDGKIRELTEGIDILKETQQDAIDAKTLALLDAEAGAFKTIGAQVDVLTYQLEAARRRLRQLLQKQMDPKSELIPNSVIERAVDNIQRIEIALQTLRNAANIKYFADLYEAIGSADIGMQLLDAHIQELEDDLRYLSEQNLENTKLFDDLADRLFALTRTKDVINVLSNSFDEFFDAVIDGSENLGEVMGQIFKNIMLDTIKMLAKLLIVKTVMATLFPAQSAAKTAVSVGQMLGIGLKEGGVVPQGFPNDTFPARLSSGEIVIPKDKYKDIDPLRQLADKGRINAKEFFDMPAEYMKTLQIPKLQTGGVIPPGYPNDTYPAFLSSGEVVLPAWYTGLLANYKQQPAWEGDVVKAVDTIGQRLHNFFSDLATGILSWGTQLRKPSVEELVKGRGDWGGRAELLGKGATWGMADMITGEVTSKVVPAVTKKLANIPGLTVDAPEKGYHALLSKEHWAWNPKKLMEEGVGVKHLTTLYAEAAANRLMPIVAKTPAVKPVRKVAETAMRMHAGPARSADEVLSLFGITNPSKHRLGYGKYTGNLASDFLKDQQKNLRDRDLIKLYLYGEEKGFIQAGEDVLKIPLERYQKLYPEAKSYIMESMRPHGESLARDEFNSVFAKGLITGDPFSISEVMGSFIEPLDDIGGHMAQFVKNGKEAVLITQDLWKFNPADMSKKWVKRLQDYGGVEGIHTGNLLGEHKYESLVLEKQAGILDKIGKPFYLVQNNPIEKKIIRNLPGDFMWSIGGAGLGLGASMFGGEEAKAGEIPQNYLDKLLTYNDILKQTTPLLQAKTAATQADILAMELSTNAATTNADAMRSIQSVVKGILDAEKVQNVAGIANAGVSNLEVAGGINPNELIPADIDTKFDLSKQGKAVSAGIALAIQSGIAMMVTSISDSLTKDIRPEEGVDSRKGFAPIFNALMGLTGMLVGGPLGTFAGGILGKLFGGKMAKGGVVPAGYPNDTYPAWLTSGEIVLPNSYRDLDIERLMNRGSLPTGNINDEFQLLLSTYEKLVPDQATKEKVTNKVFNYNNVTEKIMKMPRVKALNKLTTPKFPKEIKINDKYLRKLTAITKTNKPPVTPTRIPKIRTPKDMGVKIPKIRTLKDVAPKVMKFKVPKIASPKIPKIALPKLVAPKIPRIKLPKIATPRVPGIKVTKDKTLNYLSKISRVRSTEDKSFEHITKTIQGSKYLAKMSRAGALPKTYMRDTHLSRLSSKDKLLPSTRMDHLEPAQNNIHITLEGKIKNRDIALMIRRMKNWN